MGQDASYVNLDVANVGRINTPVLVTAPLPASNDGAALGSATASWSDLFLASGGVVDWNNGDVTLTHASNALTVGGGDFLVANTFGIVVGHTAQIAFGAGGAVEMQVLGTGTADSTLGIAGFNASAAGPIIAFAKSRNAAIGSQTIVTAGDEIGNIFFYADDGVDFNNRPVVIAAHVTGTIAADRTPGELRFYTATDAQPSVITQRWAINNAGAFVPTGSVTLGLTGTRIANIFTTNQTTTNAETVDSSETVKSEISHYTGDALAVVKDMDIITFKHDGWLDPSGETKLGIRAESVREPLAVRMIERPDHEQYPGLNMYGLTTLLAKAVQELDAKVEALSGR